MKEKINEYLDNRLRKEEVEDILKNEEYASYYEDLKKLKEGLRELRVEPPDFVTKLGLVERRRTFARYSFAFAAVLVIVFGVVFSRSLLLERQLASNQTEITREFKSTPNMSIMGQMPQMVVRVNKDNKDVIIDELKKVASLKEADDVNSTYVFEVKGEKLKDFVDIITSFNEVEILESTLDTANIDFTSSYEVKVILETK